jgi:hypothetical protein
VLARLPLSQQPVRHGRARHRDRAVPAADDDLAGFIAIRSEIPCAAAPRSPPERVRNRRLSGRRNRIDDGPQNEPDGKTCERHDRRNDGGFTLHHDDQTRLTADRIIPDSLVFRKAQIPRNRTKATRQHAMIGSHCGEVVGGARLGKAQHDGRRSGCARPAAPPILPRDGACFARAFVCSSATKSVPPPPLTRRFRLRLQRP